MPIEPRLKGVEDLNFDLLARGATPRPEGIQTTPP